MSRFSFSETKQGTSCSCVFLLEGNSLINVDTASISRLKKVKQHIFNFKVSKRRPDPCCIMDTGNGLDHQGASSLVYVRWLREGKPERFWLRNKEGACGERDTPLLFSPCAPSRCHGARWMMEHSHSVLRER